MQLTQSRLDELVEAGCFIEVIRYGALAMDIAKATVSDGVLRFCPMYPDSGHDVHTLPFTSVKDNGRSILLFQGDEAVAGLAPYTDWPEVNIGDYLARRGQWEATLSKGDNSEAFQTFFEEA